ncbi:MAG: molecular chaperone HtpG [Bacteroidales bacterium]|nr:molecular chaperone HtpG [Bacteroidales bacterium]
MQKGRIGVTTENIFPIIKKFLYSDHEIFLRELVSNAVDATQKLKTLASVGEFNGDLGDDTIRIAVDKKKKTVTVSDRGVGMTPDELDKYLNQIAFSSANDFLDKYKEQANAIIGHFGLGFYSSFMVAEKVEVVTRSWKEGEKAVKWTCDGSPEYQIEDAEREHTGTDVILHLDSESKEFLEESRIEELLRKYCKFLPVPVAFGKEKEWKKDKYVDTDRDKIINNTEPAWTRKPADLKDEDYLSFYRELYPAGDEPLFNIHLNVDYPFNLTGILYFPRIKSNLEIQKNKIQLYSNQVFVTDSVEGIVPEFLTLLHGVLDSPDIPLNVSRSYLQSDSNVKKISGHINKKVAERLGEIFKNNREDFEKKWDDLKLFIEYGMISDEKFYERAEKFALLKNTEGKYFTYEEYANIIKENQTDRNKTLVYLYANDRDSQFTYIEKARNRGYDVLMMDGQLDTHLINHLETKFKESRFVRVDADTVEKLIEKDEKTESRLNEDQQAVLREIFETQLRTGDHLTVITEAMSENDSPVVITRSEFMRRMKDMSALGGGMGFYGDLPDSYNLVVNTNHEKIGGLIEVFTSEMGEKIRKKDAAITAAGKELEEAENVVKDKKEEEKSQEEKDRIEETRKKLDKLQDKKREEIAKFASGQPVVKQLIDLALLANNMLKGEDLSKFVQRSISLL